MQWWPETNNKQEWFSKFAGGFQVSAIRSTTINPYHKHLSLCNEVYSMCVTFFSVVWLGL